MSSRDMVLVVVHLAKLARGPGESLVTTACPHTACRSSAWHTNSRGGPSPLGCPSEPYCCVPRPRQACAAVGAVVSVTDYPDPLTRGSGGFLLEMPSDCACCRCCMEGGPWWIHSPGDWPRTGKTAGEKLGGCDKPSSPARQCLVGDGQTSQTTCPRTR